MLIKDRLPNTNRICSDDYQTFCDNAVYFWCGGEFSFFQPGITGCKVAIKNSLYRLKKFNNRVHFGAITSRHVIHFKRRWHKFVKGVLPQQGGHRVVSIGTQHTLTGLFYTNPCPIFQSIVERMSSISYDVCIHGKLICPTF